MFATVKLLAPLAAVTLFVGGLRADDKPKDKPDQIKPVPGKPAFIGAKLKPGDGDKTLIVDDTLKDSPAAKAGLKAGDIIVKLDGKEVGELEAFIEAVRAHKVGDTIKVTVKRDGKEKEIKITAGSRPEPEPKPTDK